MPNKPRSGGPLFDECAAQQGSLLFLPIDTVCEFLSVCVLSALCVN